MKAMKKFIQSLFTRELPPRAELVLCMVVAVAARLVAWTHMDQIEERLGGSTHYIFSLDTVDGSAAHWQEARLWADRNVPAAGRPFYLEPVPQGAVWAAGSLIEPLAPVLQPLIEALLPQATARSPQTLPFVVIGLLLDGLLSTALVFALRPRIAGGYNRPLEVLAVHAANPALVLQAARTHLRTVEHALLLGLCAALVSARFPRPLCLAVAALCAAAAVHIERAHIAIVVCVVMAAVQGTRRIGVAVLAACAAVAACAAFIIGAGLDNPERPTTSPPDAGHLSYLWQQLLPETAEYSQAGLLLAPVLTAAALGLRLLDTRLHAVFLWADDSATTVTAAPNAAQEGSEGDVGRRSSGAEGAQGPTTVSAAAAAKEAKTLDKASDYVPRGPLRAAVPPLRVLLCLTMGLAIAVRRHYSLADTAFATIVLPLVLIPAIVRRAHQHPVAHVAVIALLISTPVQMAMYHSSAVLRVANPNWLYFSSLAHHGGVLLLLCHYAATAMDPFADAVLRGDTSIGENRQVA